jgi:transposase InsO family protein
VFSVTVIELWPSRSMIAKVFNNKLREWKECYNYDRPHGGLGGQTPYEGLRQKTQTRV